MAERTTVNTMKIEIAGLCGCLLAAGHVGLAAGPALTIKDTIGREWVNEPIVWELPDAKGDAVRLERDGRPIPAQVVAFDGGVRVLFVIDRLAKDAATTVTAEFGRPGTADTDLKVTKENDALVLANKHTAVRVNRGGTDSFSPILGVRTPSGKWTGGGAYRTTSAKPVGLRTELLERGPVRLAARVATTFDNGRTHVVTVALRSGSHSIEVDETFNVGPDDKYRFKPFENDRDELAWEWWSWYGDRDGTEETHPNNWILRLDDVELAQRSARFRGQFGVDTDLYVAVPSEAKLFRDMFVHNQCEPIVSSRHRARFQEPFSEKQVLCRVEGRPDSGFLVAFFPYKPDEPRPAIGNWLGDKGVKITWKNETHFVLLDTTEHEVNADGIRAKTACLVVKVTDPQNFSLCLPTGGEATFRGQSLGGAGPRELLVVASKPHTSSGTDLIKEAR